MRQYKYFEYLALTALLATFFAFFAVKVGDIDFWWHIAAGRHILETGVIPSVDPFGVYDAANVWGQTVLQSQWLGQVILYAVYEWFGIDGIILFRAGILMLCLAVVYLRCRVAGTATLFTMFITALAGMAILHYTGERPQLFSFLYLSLVFLLLDGFARSGGRWMLYCIPFLMLLWSNTHGGAVLGVAVLGLYGAAQALEIRLTEGNFRSPKLKLMFAVVGLSAVTLVMSPSGFDTLRYLVFLENSPIRDRVSEYASPWSLWPVTVYYWVFIGVTLVALPGLFNRSYLKQSVMVVALGAISFTAYRYIPFFVLLVAPYVAMSLSRMFSRIRLPAVAINLSVLMIALTLSGYGYKQGRILQHGIQEQDFPAGAVAFIKDNKLGGKMFNTMNWGGYLIWNLTADSTMPTPVTVFIDGRMLDPSRVAPYTNILWTTPDGLRYFEDARFDLVLIPYGNAFTGESYPIINYLMQHASWRPVYRDRAGYVFIRAEG